MAVLRRFRSEVPCSDEKGRPNVRDGLTRFEAVLRHRGFEGLPGNRLSHIDGSVSSSSSAMTSSGTTSDGRPAVPSSVVRDAAASARNRCGHWNSYIREPSQAGHKHNRLAGAAVDLEQSCAIAALDEWHIDLSQNGLRLSAVGHHEPCLLL